MDAVTNLNAGDVRIIIRWSKLDTVETDRYTFRFYPKHIVFAERRSKKIDDWLSVDILEKLFLTSSHSTKIEFWPEENREKVEQFIERLISDSGVKVEPRFELSKFASSR